MHIEHGTLVLVADAAKMLLLRNEGDDKYPVLETLDNEEIAHSATRELGSDRPGRTHASHGERSSAYDDTDWHRQAGDEFARVAAARLEAEAQRRTEVPVIVIAAPRMLGVLRQHYGSATAERLAGEIDKDLAGHVTDDIVAAIAAHKG